MMMSHMVLCEGVNIVDGWIIGLCRKWVIKDAPPLDGFFDINLKPAIFSDECGCLLKDSPVSFNCRWTAKLLSQRGGSSALGHLFVKRLLRFLREFRLFAFEKVAFSGWPELERFLLSERVQRSTRRFKRTLEIAPFFPLYQSCSFIFWRSLRFYSIWCWSQLERRFLFKSDPNSQLDSHMKSHHLSDESPLLLVSINTNDVFLSPELLQRLKTDKSKIWEMNVVL